MPDHTLGTLVTFNPRAIAPDTSLGAVYELMRRNRVRHLPVVDQNRSVVGILSDLDLLRRLQKSLVAAGDLGGLSANETIADIMTRSVVCIEHDANPQAALSLIVERRIHSVPVIQEGKLYAMISSTDFLREFSYGGLAAYRSPVLGHVSKDFDSVEMDAAPEEATRLMDERAHDGIVVMAGHRVAGVITRRAILAAQEEAGQSQLGDEMSLVVDPQVGDLVPSHPPLLQARDTLGKAASLMVEHGVKAIPVLKRSGELVGLLEERAILAAILAEIS